MDEFLNAFGPARVLDSLQVLTSLSLTFVLTLTVATVYRWTHQGLSYSRGFIHTQVLGGIVTCMLIMAIGNNLARGLGILGTLAIIRFRTPIRDPRDIIFLFCALAVGIAAGARVYMVSVVGTGFFCAAALYLHFSPFASQRQYEGLLRFIVPNDADVDADVKDILKQFTSSYALVAMREAAQGDLLEYSYQVRLRDPSFQADLMDALHHMDAVDEVSLLMQRSTVEI